jgi:NAD(P) transhydrogenase
VSSFEEVDFAVIGSGPAGQKAAICAAKEGKRVVVVERDARPGGKCVQNGTIPSKTLRETALALRGIARRSGGVIRPELRDDDTVASLMTRLDSVVRAHQTYIEEQLRRNGIALWHGRARLAGPREIEVTSPGASGQERRILRASTIILATGSKPRSPDNIEIDHEYILDSDSILSMAYLPRSLIVLGAGVIASEYASIFASLGVNVTMVDAAARPLSFLDPELTDAFVAELSATGSRFIAGRKPTRAYRDELGRCRVVLADGETLEADKVLCALGRVANAAHLGLAEVGVRTSPRGFVEVDASYRTALPHVYAIGDLIGPPSLASAAMEQGRMAARHALGQSCTATEAMIPFCAYTIPEIASIGLSESEAIAKYGSAVVGRASYSEIARAHVSASGDGLFKLVASPDGRTLLGVQIVGEGASELVHVGQMAILGSVDIDTFIEATFNFPTLAEGYRIAALDVARRRGLRRAA